VRWTRIIHNITGTIGVIDPVRNTVLLGYEAVIGLWGIIILGHDLEGSGMGRGNVVVVGQKANVFYLISVSVEKQKANRGQVSPSN
jgi:hypothetical protein